MLTKSVVFLAVLATTLAGKVPVPYQNIDVFGQGNNRIVGGTTAAVGQFPYQAIFRTTGSSYTFCGGSIVSNRWIITAGHCTYDKLETPDAVVVIVGTNQLNSGGTTMAVFKMVLHPNFNYTYLVNDISMVKTVNPIVFTSTVQPIGIGSTDKIGGNVDAIISGWGYTSYQGAASQDLQFLNVKTLKTNDCRTKFPEAYVHANTICAFKASGSGTCGGDSGGPLVANGQLIGVASAAVECAIGYPDIYSRVSSHYDWIMKKLAL